MPSVVLTGSGNGAARDRPVGDGRRRGVRRGECGGRDGPRERGARGRAPVARGADRGPSGARVDRVARVRSPNPSIPPPGGSGEGPLGDPVERCGGPRLPPSPRRWAPLPTARPGPLARSALAGRAFPAFGRVVTRPTAPVSVEEPSLDRIGLRYRAPLLLQALPPEVPFGFLERVLPTTESIDLRVELHRIPPDQAQAMVEHARQA